MRLHLDNPGTVTEHPASPVLLTSEGPHEALSHSHLTTSALALMSGCKAKGPAEFRKPCQKGNRLHGHLAALHWDSAAVQAPAITSHGLWQFEDRLRRHASQEEPLLHCSSSHNCGMDPSLVGLQPQPRAFAQGTVSIATEEPIRLSAFDPFGFSYPEGNFEGNQQPEDSMGLSPLHHISANELHVSTVTGFHPSFPGLHSPSEKIIPFRVSHHVLVLKSSSSNRLKGLIAAAGEITSVILITLAALNIHCFHFAPKESGKARFRQRGQDNVLRREHTTLAARKRDSGFRLPVSIQSSFLLAKAEVPLPPWPRKRSASTHPI